MVKLNSLWLCYALRMESQQEPKFWWEISETEVSEVVKGFNIAETKEIKDELEKEYRVKRFISPKGYKRCVYCKQIKSKDEISQRWGVLLCKVGDCRKKFKFAEIGSVPIEKLKPKNKKIVIGYAINRNAYGDIVEKQCQGCKHLKDISEFYNEKDKLCKICKKIRAKKIISYSREYQRKKHGVSNKLNINKILEGKKKNLLKLIAHYGFNDFIIFGNFRNDAIRLNENLISVNEKLVDNLGIIDVFRRIKKILESKEIESINELLPKTKFSGEDEFVEKTLVRGGGKYGNDRWTIKHQLNLRHKRGLDIKLNLSYLPYLHKNWVVIGKKQCWNCGNYKNPDGFKESHATGDGLMNTCTFCLERAAFLWGDKLQERLELRKLKARESGISTQNPIYLQYKLMPTEKISGIMSGGSL